MKKYTRNETIPNERKKHVHKDITNEHIQK